MSKSLGNIILVKDLLKDYEYQAFRLLLLSHHYRQPINYSTELMEQFNHEWQRIKRALKVYLLIFPLNIIIRLNTMKHLWKGLKTKWKTTLILPML